jgi:hypothetical protein
MSSETTKTLKDLYTGIEKQKQTLKDRTKGEESKGEISDIQLGQVKDYLNEKAVDKWKGDLDAQCMQIEIVTPDGNTMNRIMTFSSHKASNLQKWLKKYKKYPEIGDKVNLEFDGNFWQVEEL